MRLHSFVATFFVVNILLSSCGGTPIAPGVTQNGQTITVNDAAGKVTATTGAQSYPSDLPCSQYPGSEITVVTSFDEAKTAGGPKKSVMLKTKDEVAKITQFYKDQLTSGGWTIDNVVDTNGIANVHAKKDTQEINISIIGNATEGNVISISVI